MKGIMLKSDIENCLFEVTKEKTNIKGFWQDEKGRLYKDNIKLFKPSECYIELDNKINDLFFKGEKAVFIRGKKRSFIIYRDFSQDVLEQNTIIIKDKGSLKPSFIKKLLSDYKGFTVFKTKEYYLFDIWQA